MLGQTHHPQQHSRHYQVPVGAFCASSGEVRRIKRLVNHLCGGSIVAEACSVQHAFT